MGEEKHMETKEELKKIYATIQSMDLIEIKKAYELAETQEEFDFYKEIFTFQLQQKQKEVINQKDFVM